MDLTKSQKKKVRALIDLALKRDYADGIKRVKDLVNSFTENESDPKKYYHKLYKTVMDKDKDIARRYDYLTGSKYYIRLVMILGDGVLSMDEIEDLDEELKNKLKTSVEFYLS